MSGGAATPPWIPRSLSIVVPLFNEERNVDLLVQSIVRVVRPLGLPFEMVLVDDGSSDGTLNRLRALLPQVPELVVVALRRNFGQTLALQAGFDRARGDAIVTMDGDLQNDPNDIPRLLEVLTAGADVVSGWRKDRHDALFLRRIPSWVANRVIRRVAKTTIHDQGCALKAYRREVVRALDLYADMHRFVAILTMSLGARIAEVQVRHHPRLAGESKYGISRTLEVLVDLVTIQMIVWFRDRPLRWFTLLAIPFFVASVLSSLVALMSASHSVVSAAVALVAATTFLGCLLFGLLAEFVLAGAAFASRGGVVRELRERV